ncbi:MAG: S-layer protein [Methanomicrobiales archaeon HGW-Methanomicrobiales-3]|jgi:hypothetical protein|nr:MAG: S-layer protein [Methanomicrobiales archaeon HGW-Methanomicrobiales-3]
MNYRRISLVLLVCLLGCTLPVMGVTTYFGGSPQMSAVISGTNEFTPGEDAVITVVIQNRGVNSMKTDWVGGNTATPVTTRPDLSRDNYDNNYAAWQGSGTIARDDVPTTAKMVTVSLASGNAPVIVKSDPQNIGDIASAGSKTVTIVTKITNEARVGEYQLPLTIGYTYLKDADQVAADVLQSNFVTTTEMVPLTVRIKPEVQIEVVDVSAENLSVGTGGFVTLTIKNLGFEDGKKATVQLLRNANSPIIPTDSSVFIGDFPQNGVVTCRYKVGISTEAGKQTYPVDVAVTYENRQGEVVTSGLETIGIPVGGKVIFAVVSGPAEISPGSDATITVQYQNTGEIPVYAAQSRISAVSPFSSTDNTAYLGDLQPGETATARYMMAAAGDAAVKEYTLDTEVRYRDALDNSQVSDSFKVPVTVVETPAAGISGLLPVLLVVVLVAFVAGYYLLVMRKKK